MAKLKHFCLAFKALQYDLELLKQFYLLLFPNMPTEAGPDLPHTVPPTYLPCNPRRGIKHWNKQRIWGQRPQLRVQLCHSLWDLNPKTLAYMRVLIEHQGQTKHLHSLSHVILPANIWDKHYCYSHFIDVKTEALKVHSFVQQTPGTVPTNGNEAMDETRTLLSWSREWPIRQHTNTWARWFRKVVHALIRQGSAMDCGWRWVGDTTIVRVVRESSSRVTFLALDIEAWMQLRNQPC